MSSDVDPDAWRRLRYIERGIPWQQGEPGPSDRERTYRRWRETHPPVPVYPHNPDTWLPPRRAWRPCDACAQAIDLVPLPGYAAWVDSLPEGHQGRYTGNGFPNQQIAEDWQDAERRRIRESCRTNGAPAHPSVIQGIAFKALLAKAPVSEYQHIGNEDAAGKTIEEAA